VRCLLEPTGGGAEMKYKPEDYIESGFYSDSDDEIENKKEKVVRCRKPHECMGGCGKQIKVGEYALLETGFMDGKPVSCYTCLPCIDAWLDELKKLEGEDEEEQK